MQSCSPVECSLHCVTTTAVVHVNTNAKQQVISSCVILIVYFSITVQTQKNETKKETEKFNENEKKKIFKTLAIKFLQKNIKSYL